MVGVLRYPPETVAEARRLYTGTGLGPDDVALMVGDAIAEKLGIHPHTLDGWVRMHGWTRPPWYATRRPWRRRDHAAARAAIEAEVLATIAAGGPVPTNLDLSRAHGCGIHTVKTAFHNLARRHGVLSERDGPARRFVGRDGKASAWTSVRTVRRRPPSIAARTEAEARAEAATITLDRAATPVERKAPPRARILQALVQAARDGRECPSNDRLRKIGGVMTRTAREILAGLARAGLFRVERNARGHRRIVFPDGTATAWPGGVLDRRPAGTIDYAARDAVRALQRMGCHVFDVAVVTGQAWGVCWSVDGRKTTRAELIARAAERRSAAMAALQAA